MNLSMPQGAIDRLSERKIRRGEAVSSIRVRAGRGRNPDDMGQPALDPLPLLHAAAGRDAGQPAQGLQGGIRTDKSIKELSRRPKTHRPTFAGSPTAEREFALDSTAELLRAGQALAESGQSFAPRRPNRRPTCAWRQGSEAPSCVWGRTGVRSSPGRALIRSSHRRGSRWVTVVLAAAVSLLAASGAGAATFCVGKPATCPGTNVATMQEAVVASNGNGDGEQDRVEVGAGTFAGPTTGTATPVDIVGEGTGATTISGSPAATTLIVRRYGHVHGVSAADSHGRQRFAGPAAGFVEPAQPSSAANVLVTGSGAPAGAVGVQLQERIDARRQQREHERRRALDRGDHGRRTRRTDPPRGSDRAHRHGHEPAASIVAGSTGARACLRRREPDARADDGSDDCGRDCAPDALATAPSPAPPVADRDARDRGRHRLGHRGIGHRELHNPIRPSRPCSGSATRSCEGSRLTAGAKGPPTATPP